MPRRLSALTAILSCTPLCRLNFGSVQLMIAQPLLDNRSVSLNPETNSAQPAHALLSLAHGLVSRPLVDYTAMDLSHAVSSQMLLSLSEVEEDPCRER